MFLKTKSKFCSIQKLFKDRDLIFQASSQQFIEKQIQKDDNYSVYSGFDPTSDSLHLGNFIPIVNLIRLQTIGFKPIFLIGGATGQIGDPSGKQNERNILEKQIINQNQISIQNVIHKLIYNIHQYIEKNKDHLDIGQEFNVFFNVLKKEYMIMDNKEFYKDINILDFLRDIGKNFRLSSLISKDSVQSRLNSDKGISFTEFSYQLFQSHDFLKLNQQQNCVLQVGGSDQWGNMTQGCDYVRKVSKNVVNCLTFPLLVNSQNQKFGKSENNAIWLDKNQYQMNQYLLNIQDNEIEKLLKMLTFLPLQQIQQIMINHNQQPEQKIAQKIFAENMMNMIFGQNENFTEIFFQTDFKSMKLNQNDNQIQQFFQQLNNYEQKKIINLNECKNILDLLNQMNICKSKHEIRKNVDDQSIQINGIKIQKNQLQEQNFQDHLIGGKHIVVKLGKKKFFYSEII